jgi:hypothetical protein
MLNSYQERWKLSYYKLTLYIVFIIFLNLPVFLQAQEMDTTSTENLMDSVQTSLWPALIRSAIIPGWGQIEQEHTGRAFIFYTLGLNFIYNVAYNYRWYQKTNDYNNKVKMRRYAMFLLQLYTINLIDVIESHRAGDDKQWPNDMFSNQPSKSPWGAVTRSAMLPGWGQCHNESYIKSVAAFGSFFYFASRVYDYGKEYRRTGDIETRDKRVLHSWYLGLTYFLILVDSYVDAYLYRFEETIQLTYDYLPEDRTVTLGVRIAF